MTRLLHFTKKPVTASSLALMKKDMSLGMWVTTQRRVNQEEIMRPDRFKLQQDIDFVWKVDYADPEASLTQRQWDEMNQHLVEFKETRGHNVPMKYLEWGLGIWVMTQRKEAKNGCLDSRRADKLTAIGFTWRKDHDEEWEENVARLLAFKREGGHCNVPQKNSTCRLESWVNQLRAAKKNETLKPEREARLEAAGFISNGQSRNEPVVKESDSDDELDSSKGSNNGECNNNEPHVEFESTAATANETTANTIDEDSPVEETTFPFDEDDSDNKPF
jgi:hypothetical protein